MERQPALDQNMSMNMMDDLKVTVHDTSLVFPKQGIPRTTMFLSNIDQVLNFDVQTIHFFPPPIPPETTIADTLRDALSELLTGPYHFLSGRLTSNPKTGRLEFDCNSAGAGFVVASTDYTLDDIGDLVYPNPAFAQLVTKTIPTLGPHPHDQPLCILQVTSFKCGGFALGTTTNHATFDGSSFKVFLQNLAAVAAGKPLHLTPCNDRHLLAARSPPQVTFPHPELLKLNNNLLQDGSSSAAPTPPVFEDSNQDLDFKIFRLTSEDIAALKDKAKSESKTARATGFNVVTAHVWRCKALSNVVENDPDLERESRILFAVDIRGRINPPLPQSYTGNAVLTAYAAAKCKELREEGEGGRSFGRLVEMAMEGANRMRDEYARSAIDWGEVYKGFPHGEVLVSSWWRLGFEEVEYPWGKPRYSCPLVYRRKDIILLFPDIDRDPNSVNVLVALPKNEMDVFQHLFHKFLPSSSASSSS